VTKGVLAGQNGAEMTDLATELVLHSIDTVVFLREQMEEAVRLIVNGRSAKARQLLDAALEKTDVGEMKVWLPGVEPF
jgi:hypothetical protein